MEKAIEIKRRAQRCINSGDLDGALSEYRKLVTAEDSDPYNFVLLADLLYKKGDAEEAAERYLEAARAYQTNTLFKNAIAVCKKMLRLQLRPVVVLERLGELHALDGLGTEAQLYYTQFADLQLRENKLESGADSLRKAFDACKDDPRVLERLSQVRELQGKSDLAAQAMIEAAQYHEAIGRLEDARRCRERAYQLDPAAATAASPTTPASLPISAAGPPPRPVTLETGTLEQRPPALSVPESTTNGALEGLERFPGGAPEEAPPALRIAPEPDATGTADVAEPPPVAAVPPVLSLEPAAAEVVELTPTQKIEELLGQAQEAFRRGDRDAAAELLAAAAAAYESIDRLEDAAVIYRNLGRAARAPERALRLWFANAERRKDPKEAALVACELGDRALGRSDEEDARAWFGQALALDDSCEHARRRIQRLSNLHTAPPAPAAAPAGRVEIASDRNEATSFDLSSMLAEFERGIENQLSGDAQGHYDLAMTYREMGLLEQAVDSFRRASGDPAYGQRCAEMIGRCLLDQGRFEEAAQEFSTALQQSRLGHEAAVSLRFQLGLAFEAAGRLEEALDQFQQVFQQQPSFPDVALKIRVLKKALEQV